MLDDSRKRALTDGMEFSIDAAYLTELLASQGGLCFYSGRQLSLGRGGDAISLDRVDSQRGYTPENVVLATWQVNCMKREMPREYFVSLCHTIARIGTQRDK
jgi:hypothetical protein